MKLNRSILILSVVIILLSPFLFKKHLVPLVAGGKTIAVAKCPLVIFSTGDQEVGVYGGQTKLFALWTDVFHGPVFIHPFKDGTRFLCDYNDDVGMLVFVIDFGPTTMKATDQTNWPPNEDVRKYITSRMTNVVLSHTGVVRLPTLPELKEASSDVMAMSSQELKSASFRWCDLGMFKTYASKVDLLKDWATNRQNFW